MYTMLKWLKSSLRNICSTGLYAPIKLCLDLIAKLANDKRGNVMITTVIALPVLALAVGTAIEHGMVITQKSRLQAAVDAAAVSTAREMSLSDANQSTLTASAEAAVAFNLSTGSFSHGALSVAVQVNQNDMTVTVSAKQEVEQIFAGMGFNISAVDVSAEAQIVGTVRVCVIGLEERSAGAIWLNDNSQMTGNGCAVFSNSSSTQGIKSMGGSVLSASLICSAGGSVGGAGNFTPEPLTDCPRFEDPLADRPEPSTGPCIESNLEINSGYVVLSPGTYCGGITIDGSAKVKLEPGIYIMQDGPLKVSEQAELVGQYVGFYFTGNKSSLYFGANTTIDIEAPKDGIMAGILMFETRNPKGYNVHEIYSNNARNLLGTIYFPEGGLYVDADAPIADQSAYTAIIAGTIELFSGLHLVLNTNYDQTDIPVPAGVRGMSENIRLTR